MKIVYYYTPSFADCDFPLIREYQKRGIDVYFLIKLTPYNRNSTLINIKEQIPVNGIFKFSEYAESHIFTDYLNLDKVYIVNQLNSRNFSLPSFILAWKLIWFILKLKVSVVHTTVLNDWDSLLLLFKRKLVLTLHDPFPHTGEKNVRKEFFRCLAIKYSSKIILLNQVQKQDFMDLYHVSEKRIIINRLGIYDSINVYKRNLPLKEDSVSHQKKILFFGRISPYKGIEYLLEAMNNVHIRYPNVICTVMGSGNFYFDITEYLNLPHVKIINRFIPTDELISAIEESTMVVCPYTDATQSGVIYTSYALYKPVIATNVGGFCESVIDSVTGMLVPPKDVKSLENAILYLLEHPEKCAQMGDEIKKNADCGLFSWDNIAEKYMNIYDMYKAY